MTLMVGSLFAGIGGFDLGLERAGMRVEWQAELDPAARGVLRRHWPDVRQVDDVKLVGTHHPFATFPVECDEDGCGRDELECIGIAELADPGIDVLCGGFPCQDISSAGDRWGAKGLDGERSGLWWEFARIIGLARPRFVVIENTGRLRNGREGADLRGVLAELDRLGYVGVGGVLDAAAFELPARRPRVIIVAGDARLPGGVSVRARLANSWLRHDPGCVVLEGSGQSLTTDAGCKRPTPGSYRLLTPREAERALGFPDDWTAGHANSVRLRMVGNAVAVPVAEWIGRVVVETADEGGGVNANAR